MAVTEQDLAPALAADFVRIRDTKTQEYKPRIQDAISTALTKTDLNVTTATGAIAERYVGKVRDRYNDGTNVILVTCDRMTAFDRPLANIPFKGAVLNMISAWWFDQTAHIMGNHKRSAPHPNVTIGKAVKPFLVEFVVRDYLTGSTGTSIKTLYEKGERNFGGITLPDGMTPHQKLPQTIITPTTKEDVGHDRPLTPEEIVSNGLMTQEQWDYAAAKAIALFKFAQAKAAERGLILVDTKIEMGVDADDNIIVIDELFTPDSSRYWLAEGAEEAIAAGKSPKNIDKEFLRLWMKAKCTEMGIDPSDLTAAIPEVPEDQVIETARRYILLYEAITGLEFPFDKIEAAPALETAVQDALERLKPSSKKNDASNVLTFAGKHSAAAAPSLLELAVPPAKKATGHEKYKSPLDARYASEEMVRLWSDDKKFALWRKMWALIARGQMLQGADITEEQVAELEAAVDQPIDYEFAAAEEKRRKHDVMAHVATLARVCPKAGPKIHLSATSCDVTDNAELLQLKEALLLTKQGVLQLLNALREFAQANKEVVTLGYTHGQAAQLTTVGKRACMWAEGLLLALDRLTYEIDHMKLRGLKGATGTQATLLALFNGDHEKVDALEEYVCQELGFTETYDATGQTYPRNAEVHMATAVAGIGIAIGKMCEDIRLLASHGEISEPFDSSQIGSSAMAYKQNPMRCERVCSIVRDLIGQAQQPSYTATTQWLERSLDDSANRRIVLPEIFLMCDAVNKIALNVVQGLRVNQARIGLHVQQELPFMVTEQIILDSVAKGGDRQQLHEAIRELSLIVVQRVKEQGLANNLIDLICADERFPQEVRDALMVKALNPVDYIGRCTQQVDKVAGKIEALLAAEKFDKAATSGYEMRV